MNVRDELRKHYAWAIPNEEALDALVSHAPIVEIGAGSGYWAHLIEDRGGTVYAYDKAPHGNSYTDGRRYYPVREGRVEKARRHSGCTLFLCWPDDFNQKQGWSDEALDLYLNSGGETLVYVGEGRNGCTGSERLFDLIDRRMTRTTRIEIPQYQSLHDAMHIFESKT